MDNYKQVLEKLKEHIPFSGNTMRGYKTDTAYKVYSYNLCIAIWYFGDDNPSIDTGKFRTTTTRHQNLVRKAWAA